MKPNQRSMSEPAQPEDLVRTPEFHDSQLATKQCSLVWQIGFFVTFMGAVLSSRFLDLYRNAIPGNPLTVDWKYILFAAIVSLAAFPVAYEKAMQSKSAPILVQVGMVFMTGLGWEKILSTVSYIAK